jgi:DNA-binding IclR family transcriptional regulator
MTLANILMPKLRSKRSARVSELPSKPSKAPHAGQATQAEASRSVHRYRAPALEKGLDVLELLAKQGAPMSLVQISTALDRSVSELFRMVQVLQHRGYVQIADTGDGYVLTDRLFALGVTRAPTKDLLDAALPLMRRYALETKQSCHLAVVSGDQIVVVLRVEAAGDLGFSVRIGFRRSLLTATSGLVLYAFQPEAVRKEWKARFGPTVSASAWSKFEARAKKARSAGYVRIPSDITRGVVDISAPVMRWGVVVAAFTCPHIQTDISLDLDETLKYVQSTARAITADLAGLSERSGSILKA